MKKQQTRREFLKCSGTIFLLVGSGCAVPVNSPPTDPTAPIQSQSGLPTSDGYLIVDTRKCQGCASCMLACSLVHEGVESLSHSRIQIIQNSFASYPDDVAVEQCRQCVDPACVEACPVDALTADARFGNARVVDFEKCIGCGECVDACPFSPSRSQLAVAEKYDGDDKAYKCDLCSLTPYHWDAAGGGPEGKLACVEVCPVGAIAFTREIPVQKGDEGYKVNLRGSGWAQLKYPTG
ncbi:MAG: 4Fe-4S dicluster domain-containing protein [Deltaproteobacteria bacterium]|nr:4Fe-4S dicluster domain-containing protein [Deltaproteobacteria bacterium]